MILSEPQKTIANDPARFKVAVCGRRFGKTYLSVREIAYRARIPNREVFYITTSYRAAKMIVWKPLKRRLMDLRWVSKINESELSILLKNGTTIALKGSEDPDKLRGVSLDFAVIDEAADCKLETLWGEIVRPALADRQGGALFIGTPKGRSNPLYDLFQFARDPLNTDWNAFQYTTLDGGFVPEKEVEAAKKDMSEKQFRQEFLASFETDESRVAWAFDRDTHVIDLPKDIDTRIIYVGMDFNVSPMTATIAVQTGNKLTVIDELTVYGSNTDEIADEIITRYPKSKIFVYPDPAGAQRKTSANGQTDHKILENRGFVVKAPRRHDLVKDRINAINARFKNAVGEVNLYIGRNCKKTIESLEKHSFKPGTSIPDKDTGYDHQFDSLSYMVAYLYPISGPKIEVEPSRWGHSIV
jgi:phage terminase large subunit